MALHVRRRSLLSVQRRCGLATSYTQEIERVPIAGTCRDSAKGIISMIRAAPPANLRDKDFMMKYVIRYNLNPKSYFRQMTGIGPAFGATREQSPRFDSKREAGDAIAKFPIVASTCCEVEPVES